MTKNVMIAALLLGCSVSVMADAPAAYSKCVSCHGAKGEKAALGKSKIISSMSKAEVAEALKGYQNGTYGGPMKALMKGQVAALSDADMDAIAAFVGQ